MNPILLLALSVLLVSCDGGREMASGPPVTETKKGSIGKSEMLQADVKMPAGELRIDGVDGDEVSAEFRYSSGATPPTLRLDTSTFRARAVIEQGKGSVGAKENFWTVKLPNRVVTDLEVSVGAGEARMNLGSIDLRKVNLQMGAGKVVADFAGEPKRDYEVSIQGGVGECNLTLPKAAGIRVEAQGGIGSIDVSGLNKVGDKWESADFGAAKTKLRVSIQGGIGKISVNVR